MGDTVSFTDTSTYDGGPIVTWFWDSGDTHTADGSTTSHVYDAPGACTVTLLITDTCGYTDTSDVPIVVYAALDVNIVGSGSVDKDPDQLKYSYGDVVTLTATADPGWTFDSWSGDLSGSANPITTIYSSQAITATFTQEGYVLDITTVGNGDVDKDPDQSSYHYGDVVTLTATADPGWTFDGWSGDLSGATFTQEGYVLDIAIVGSGNVLKDPDQVTYAYSDVVTLTATADPDWAFDSWSGDLTGTTSPIAVTMNSSKAVTATFRAASPAPTEKYLYLPMIQRN